MAPVLTLFFTFPFLFNAPKQHLLLLIHHPQTTSTFCRIHPSPPLPQPTLDLQDHVCLCSPAPWFPALRLLLATVSHLFPDFQGLVCKTARSLPCCLHLFIQSQRFSGLSSALPVLAAGNGVWELCSPICIRIDAL